MDYRTLLKRLDAAKQHNAGKIAIQLRIRVDEMDSLIHSIRSLSNLNEQYRGRVKAMQEAMSQLESRIQRQDETLASRLVLIHDQKTQITQHERRIQHLETEMGDDDGDGEMNIWYQRLIAEQQQKRARARG